MKRNPYHSRNNYWPKRTGMSGRGFAGNSGNNQLSHNESAFSTERSSFDLLKSVDYLNSEEGKKFSTSRFKLEKQASYLKCFLEADVEELRTEQRMDEGVLEMCSKKFIDHLIKRAQDETMKRETYQQKAFLESQRSSDFSNNFKLPSLARRKFDKQTEKFDLSKPKTDGKLNKILDIQKEASPFAAYRNKKHHNMAGSTTTAFERSLFYEEGKVEKNIRDASSNLYFECKMRQVRHVEKFIPKAFATLRGSEFLKKKEDLNVQRNLKNLKKVEGLLGKEIDKMRKKYLLDDSEEDVLSISSSGKNDEFEAVF